MKAIFPFLIQLSCGGVTHAFSVPNVSPRDTPPRPETFPLKTEDWDPGHVGRWLRALGFGRYAPGFAADFGGVGVDGCRLDYLGTEDNLDHIEYQLSLVGVEDEGDQRAISVCWAMPSFSWWRRRKSVRIS